jgi:hypothetical protein
VALTYPYVTFNNSPVLLYGSVVLTRLGSINNTGVITPVVWALSTSIPPGSQGNGTAGAACNGGVGGAIYIKYVG